MHIVLYHSHDFGRSWGEPEPVAEPNPDAREGSPKGWLTLSACASGPLLLNSGGKHGRG